MKKYKPTSPSRRAMTGIDYRNVLSGHAPTKSLMGGFRRGSGRNSAGRLTTRHKGGGVKRNYRFVDFRMEKMNVPAVIKTLEYDPNRTGFIALAVYKDGEKRYVLAPNGVKVGQEIITAEGAPVVPGNRLMLKNAPVGTFVYNVEIKPKGGAKLGRSAGIYIEVIAQDGNYTLLKMPSTEVRKVHNTCFASVGAVSNDEHHLVVIGKAGRNRKLGVRPTVRGSVMNPVDHPHGGGEGRQGRGLRRAKSKWGKPTGKGQKTRTPKKYSNRLIVTRRRVGKKK